MKLIFVKGKVFVFITECGRHFNRRLHFTV